MPSRKKPNAGTEAASSETPAPKKAPAKPPRSMEELIEHLHTMRDKAEAIYRQLDVLTKQVKSGGLPPRKSK
jgi:hypothetical protein